jgi:hypothetical protein
MPLGATLPFLQQRLMAPCPAFAQNVPTTGQSRSSVKVVAGDRFKRISCKTEALFSLGFWRAAGIGRVQTAANADSRKAIAARSKPMDP